MSSNRYHLSGCYSMPHGVEKCCLDTVCPLLTKHTRIHCIYLLGTLSFETFEFFKTTYLLIGTLQFSLLSISSSMGSSYFTLRLEDGVQCIFKKTCLESNPFSLKLHKTMKTSQLFFSICNNYRIGCPICHFPPNFSCKVMKKTSTEAEG